MGHAFDVDPLDYPRLIGNLVPLPESSGVLIEVSQHSGDPVGEVCCCLREKAGKDGEAAEKLQGSHGRRLYVAGANSARQHCEPPSQTCAQIVNGAIGQQSDAPAPVSPEAHSRSSHHERDDGIDWSWQS
jgi:hypothetical protein